MSVTEHTRAVDVAVIGGGIIGRAVAWRAAQHGLSVAVVDERSPGRATSVAAGMLGPVSEVEFGPAARPAAELGMAAAAMWPAFAAELEAAAEREVRLLRTGTLLVARDRDEAEALERGIRWRTSLGLPVQRLRGSQARELEPALAPTVRLALHAPDDHSVDPRLVSAALRSAAERLGVALHDADAPAELRVHPAGGRVQGVAWPGAAPIAADRVVLAAGAWSGRVAGVPAGAVAPVRPVKGQILRLRDPSGPGLLNRVVRYEGGYLVPRGDGHYVLGGTVEERGFDCSPTSGGVLDLLRDARELVPGVTEMEVEEVGVGLRPGSPDNLPLIGASPLQGLVWATGVYRNGILLAPLVAEIVVAELTGAPAPEVARLCAASRLSALGAPA